MTPELKTACELVFQEHKLSTDPIKWDKDAFRGRISIGLSEMAKETLVKKNIILSPTKSKKLFTQLNPDVATAGNFEEAEKLIETKVPNFVSTPTYDAETYITNHVFGFSATPTHVYHERPVAAKVSKIKWYLKPFYLYVAWPICGAAGGLLISRLMDLAYTALFLSAR
jgi:hypothetical protein